MRFGDHLFIAGEIRHIDVTAEPVRKLFPTVLPAVHKPSVVALFEPFADRAELPGEPFVLTFERFAEPTFGLDGAERQLQERRRFERSPVRQVMRRGVAVFRTLDDANVVRRERADRRKNQRDACDRLNQFHR